MAHSKDTPFGERPFGTAPFGPQPEGEGEGNFIDIIATGFGEGLFDAAGAANIDLEALGVFTSDLDGAATLGIVASAAGAFSRARVRVIATAPHANRGVTTQPFSRTINTAPNSGRGRTGLSHTGLN